MELDALIVFCLVIMVFVIIKTIRDKSISKLSKNYFIFCLLSAVVMLLADGTSIMINDKYMQSTIGMNYAAQIIYFISASFVCYLCLLLVDSMGDTPFIKGKLKLILLAPISIYIILLFISIGTGWIFSINNDNKYVRGPINFFQFIFCHTYLVAALVISIYKYIKFIHDPNRSLYFSNVLFCVVPIVAAFIQYGIDIIYDNTIPFVSCSIALSAVIIFTEMIQNQVSIDSLTGISSRKAFYKYLYSLNKPSLDHFYVFMIDINKFKTINDRFGHLEGDNALKIFANALRDQTRKNKGFAARLGGDEFSIAVELLEDNPEEYVLDLNNEIDKHVKISGICYEIKASIGYSRLENNETIQELIKKADEEMYIRKQSQR